MPEALRSRPPSAVTPTKAPAAPAPPVKAPATTWPPAVLAELQRNTIQIRNRYGKPDQIAAYLHDWIRRHTQEQLMGKTVKANLGPLGDIIPDWAEGVSTSVANGVLGAAAAQDLTTGSTRHLTQTRHDADRAGLTNFTGAYQARNVVNGSGCGPRLKVVEKFQMRTPTTTRTIQNNKLLRVEFNLRLLTALLSRVSRLVTAP